MSTGVGPTGYARSRKGRPTPIRPWPSDGSLPRAGSLPATPLSRSRKTTTRNSRKNWGWRRERENKGARRRRRHLRESFCGDGECASGRQTIGKFAAALTNASVCSLPVLTFDRHAFRHVADCRLSARGHLHRDLHFAAGRHAVVAYTQFLGY
eukprot:1833614-Pleurochrysis_carterae.AAC.1